MAADVQAAIVAAGAALIGVAVNGYFTWRTSMRQEEIERFKSDLQAQLSERNALRSYEFDAKKKIYAECEPILFQISESFRSLRLSLIKINDTSITKDFSIQTPTNAGQDAWMMNSSSKLISILYDLLKPMALFCILRERITGFDLRLDPSISFRYALVRAFYATMHSDEEIAKLSPWLDYSPVVSDWRKLRIENPNKYWWQGITPGRLDNAVRLLICDGKSGDRVITFGEFENFYKDAFTGSNISAQKRLGVFANAFYGFTHETRPVFCRIILILICICEAFLKEIPSNIDEIRKSECLLSQFIELDTPFLDSLSNILSATGWTSQWSDLPISYYLRSRLA